MKHFRIRRPVLFFAGLFSALYFDRAGLVRVGLLASLLHECGHAAAWWALTGTLPVLRFSLRGIGLDAAGARLGRGGTFLLALAGPLANFLLCGLILLKMQISASYWGYCFAAANLAVGLFNLLPAGDLDGRRMLACLRR